jgi:hypothetical protein
MPDNQFFLGGGGRLFEIGIIKFLLASFTGTILGVITFFSGSPLTLIFVLGHIVDFQYECKMYILVSCQL